MIGRRPSFPDRVGFIADKSPCWNPALLRGGSLTSAGFRADALDAKSLGELTDLLQELLDLLDEYGPGWYSEELHSRLVQALAKMPQESHL